MKILSGKKNRHKKELETFCGLWAELRGVLEKPDEKFLTPDDALRLFDLKLKILEQYFPFNSLFSDPGSAAFRMLDFCRSPLVHGNGIEDSARLLEDCVAVCGVLEDYRVFLDKQQ